MQAKISMQIYSVIRMPMGIGCDEQQYEVMHNYED